ncbi:alpha/beta hydrolase family protein [Thiothrix lacustris]|uniref:alpha/beta hydrolase family protein n=1 Tax=Thiothrix lacustris TaxID=525917 RepID=UPI0027E4120E|nr:alpha/beta hydrolase [Thiothrix lacustris]WMP19456.1 alpha/beta hydrolase [Thiothrix lacustris]
MVAIADHLGGLEPFFIEFEQTYLHGDMLLDAQADRPPAILFLHGAEQNDDRSQFFLLRHLLFRQYGLSSCTFDFIGHGSTGGEKRNSSLQQRTLQANDIVDACFDSQPFSIVAVGMSAYTALKLTEMACVRHLVLMMPMIYCSGAYSVTFGDEAFEQLANCSCSTARSDALVMVEHFQGRLCQVAATQEMGCSTNVIEHLYEKAVNATQRQVLSTPCDATQLMGYANKNPLFLKRLADNIASVCQEA